MPGVVRTPGQTHRAGQCPSRKGFSDFLSMGRFQGAGVGTVDRESRFSYSPNKITWVRLWVRPRKEGVLPT